MLIFSALFTLSCVARRLIFGQDGFVTALMAAGCMLVTTLLCFTALMARDRWKASQLRERASQHSGKRWTPRLVFWVALAAIVLFWGFYYLLYYPGCASTDSNDILKMVLGQPFESNHFRYDELNSHHPLLYTGLVALFVHVGSLLGGVTFGVGLFTLFQMITLALMCAWALRWLYVSTHSKSLWVMSLVFFACNPLIARYAVTIWKDVPFAGVVLLLCLVVVEIARTRGAVLKKKTWLVAFVLLLAGVVLLRSNGFLVAVIVVGALILFCRRGEIFRVVCSGVGAVVGIFIAQSLVFTLLGVAPAHFSESVSLPLQQIARSVVEGGEIGEEQSEVIEGVLPLERIEELYLPITPNTLKFAPDFDDAFLESHKVEFLYAWVSSFPANVGSYMRAWYDETNTYWSVTASSWLVVEAGYDLYDRGVNRTESLLPSLAQSENSPFSGERPTEGVRALVPFLFNVGCIVWFMLFCVMAQACFRRKASMFFYLPNVVLWATFLVAAPIATEFRYMFSLFLALPFFFALWLHPVEEWDEFSVSESVD